MTDPKNASDLSPNSLKPRKIMREISSILRDQPGFAAAAAIGNVYSGEAIRDKWEPGIDILKMQALLDEQTAAVSSGDLSRLEEILTAQVHVLQSVFTSYIGRASRAEFTEQLNCYMGISMKAQSQCRQTVSLLGELKNPKRTTFIQQQNNAVNQQINQNKKASTDEQTGAQLDLLEKIPSPSNELLETKIERMDERASTKTK